MLPTAETIQAVSEWRRRASLPAGHPEAMGIAEWRDAIRALRGDRFSAATASEAKKAAKGPVDTAGILKGFLD
jgi:hypothetical protein